MNKERFKSLFLFCLVLISIFLTQQLWIEVPEDLLSSFIKSSKEENQDYVISDAIYPKEYLINFGGKNHTILYSDINYELWEIGRKVLKDLFSSDDIKIETISSEDFNMGSQKRSIDFYFSEKMHTYMLAKILNVKIDNSFHKSIDSINNIHFYLGQNAYIIFSDGEKNIKVSNTEINIDEMRKIVDNIENNGYTYYYPVRDFLEIDNDIYISFNMKEKIPPIYVKSEIDVDYSKQVDEIADIFFDKDLDYVRKIVENNGSIIYVYDQQTLKIYENGLIEFFSSIDEPVNERNLYTSLNTAIEFIYKHMGFPKGSYISDIKEIEYDNNKGYSFIFTYSINGIPVVTNDEIIPNSIEIDVFNEYVKGYRRFVRKSVNNSIASIEENSTILSSFDVWDKNYDFIQKNQNENKKISKDNSEIQESENAIENSIKDIYLAYYDPCEISNGQKVEGVWVIKVDDVKYAFDIYDGELVHEWK